MNALVSNLGVCDGAHWLVVMEKSQRIKTQYPVLSSRYPVRVEGSVSVAKVLLYALHCSA